MIGTLIVTHGSVAESLVETIGRIIGPSNLVGFYGVDWDEEVAEAREKLGRRIKEMDQGEGVLILTDMFGGTPTNVSMSFHDQASVEIITGVNLPMIMKALTLPAGMNLQEAARQVKDQGQRSIYIASELVGSGK